MLRTGSKEFLDERVRSQRLVISILSYAFKKLESENTPKERPKI